MSSDHNGQWFKFMLHFEGGSYKPLEHQLFVKQKVIRRTLEGSEIESRVTIRDIPLDYKVESKFRGEFICEPNFLFQGSDVERCFDPWLYPLVMPEASPPREDAQGYPSDDDVDIWEYLQGRDPYY